MHQQSLLHDLRLKYEPKLPKMLENIASLKCVSGQSREKKIASNPSVKEFFPKTFEQPTFVSFAKNQILSHQPKRVGVVLSGGQAAGGHNVIIGLFDALKLLNSNSLLFGFCDGPKGIIENKYIELTENLLSNYRNQGGFDLIGSGRTKIETPEQFEASEKNVRALNLDGLVIIGGDDSNTIAALLSEYFLAKECKTVVVGAPKTIDGDLANADIEISFGFDTATKTYSETIGNIMRDALSAKKSYYFIKMMGRSASHVTLECALRTHPNLALIGEEIAAKQKTFQQLVQEMCQLIEARSQQGKEYGVFLIPEGVIEFIPEFKILIQELNSLLAENSNISIDNISSKLSQNSLQCFKSLPKDLQMQMIADRDPHGNVQVSKIETEKLFMEAVKTELKKRKSSGTYKGSFSGQPHFCGYEGRSAYPTNFDAQYCYSLGYVAALLINAEKTGYICCVQNLTKPVEAWQAGARSLATMMTIEKRKGKNKPVIGKALVDLQDKPFKKFESQRELWKFKDEYGYPGPIQFFGPAEITESIPLILTIKS